MRVWPESQRLSAQQAAEPLVTARTIERNLDRLGFLQFHSLACRLAKVRINWSKRQARGCVCAVAARRRQERMR